MIQDLLFDLDELKPASPVTQKTDDYNYEADDAEAVVYLTAKDGWIADMYVMKRHEAVAFCSRLETAKNYGPMSWMFCFTTHRRDWREYDSKTFRIDDGRFDWLLAELDIEPIYWLKTPNYIKQGDVA